MGRGARFGRSGWGREDVRVRRDKSEFRSTSGGSRCWSKVQTEDGRHSSDGVLVAVRGDLTHVRTVPRSLRGCSSDSDLTSPFSVQEVSTECAPVSTRLRAVRPGVRSSYLTPYTSVAFRRPSDPTGHRRDTRRTRRRFYSREPVTHFAHTLTQWPFDSRKG